MPHAIQSAPDPDEPNRGLPRIDDAAVRELVAQFRRGSESARTWLYRLLFTHAVLLAAVHLKRDQAEDVAGALLVELVGPRPDGKTPGILRYDSERPFRPWFESVVIRRAIDRLRSETSRIAREREVGVRQYHDRPDWGNGESAAAKKEALDRLQQIRRNHLTVDENVLLERWMNRESYEQIATALGIPVGTVASRLNKIRSILKEQFRGQV